VELVPAIAAASVVVLVAAAVHVWYAWGLARLFAGQGQESWRAWVPLANEAEILRLGRLEPVKAVLLLVPFVAVYALVLRAIAAHRIGALYGRGAGMTTLAVLLPPVWATVLSGQAPVADDTAVEADDDAAAALAGAVPAAALPASAQAAALPAVAPALPPAGAPISAVPLAAAPAAGMVGSAPAWPAAGPTAAPPQTAAPQAPGQPVPQAPGQAVPQALGQPASAASAAPSEAQPLEPARPRTRRPGHWELALPGGQNVTATARTIVLGRKPAGGDPAVQYVTVDDATRTVSKEHARIQWAGDGWTITDLGSTNGVTVIAADGSEQRLASGATAPLVRRFLLGDAVLELGAAV
jgi:hypothetical protein